MPEKPPTRGAEEHPGARHQQDGYSGFQESCRGREEFSVRRLKLPAAGNETEEQSVQQPPFQAVAMPLQADKEGEQPEPGDGPLQDAAVFEKTQGQQHRREGAAEKNPSSRFFPGVIPSAFGGF